MKKLSTLLLLNTVCILMINASLGQSAKYREVFYDAVTHISRNFVRFENTNNTYYGYDFTINVENIVTNAVVDWSFSKMAEIVYTDPINLSFTNAKNWVTYSLKATGTNTLTWSTNNFVAINTFVANSNHNYIIHRYGDGNDYVYQFADTVSSGDASQWSFHPALTDVTVGENKLYLADGAYLYSEGTNLWFVHP